MGLCSSAEATSRATQEAASLSDVELFVAEGAGQKEKKGVTQAGRALVVEMGRSSAAMFGGETQLRPAMAAAAALDRGLGFRVRLVLASEALLAAPGREVAAALLSGDVCVFGGGRGEPSEAYLDMLQEALLLAPERPACRVLFAGASHGALVRALLALVQRVQRQTDRAVFGHSRDLDRDSSSSETAVADPAAGTFKHHAQITRLASMSPLDVLSDLALVSGSVADFGSRTPYDGQPPLARGWEDPAYSCTLADADADAAPAPVAFEPFRAPPPSDTLPEEVADAAADAGAAPLPAALDGGARAVGVAGGGGEPRLEAVLFVNFALRQIRACVEGNEDYFARSAKFSWLRGMPAALDVVAGPGAAVLRVRWADRPAALSTACHPELPAAVADAATPDELDAGLAAAGDEAPPLFAALVRGEVL